MTTIKREKRKYHTPDGIPWYRTFNGIRYLLIGGRFRKKENAIKFAKLICDFSPKGLANQRGIRARIVKNPNGRTWLIYRTPDFKDNPVH